MPIKTKKKYAYQPRPPLLTKKNPHLMIQLRHFFLFFFHFTVFFCMIDTTHLRFNQANSTLLLSQFSLQYGKSPKPTSYRYFIQQVSKGPGGQGGGVMIEAALQSIGRRQSPTENCQLRICWKAAGKSIKVRGSSYARLSLTSSCRCSSLFFMDSHFLNIQHSVD